MNADIVIEKLQKITKVKEAQGVSRDKGMRRKHNC